jgi:hypothetical protein
VFGFRERKFRLPTAFAAAFWAFSFLGTAAGLYFRRHYFILVLPAFAILIGLGVACAQETLRPKLSSKLAILTPWMIFAALLGWNVFSQEDILFQFSPEVTCQKTYPENPFAEAPKVAEYIRSHPIAGARIAVVGGEPEIYFYTRLHSATTFLYGTDLMQAHPYAMKMQHDMIHEIESGRPDYLVFVSYENSWCVQTNADQEIFDWFDKYSAEFYDKVGIVETLPDGQIFCFWDDNAAHMDNAAIEHHHLEVYRRRPL